MGWDIIDGPAEEPVSLAELEDELQGPINASLGAFMIRAARKRAEIEAGVAIGEQTIRMTLSRFPVKSDDEGLVFVLLSWPVGRVLKFEYLDTRGRAVAVKESEYSLDTSVRPARVEPTTEYWPLTQKKVNAVTIEYRMGAPATDEIKLAIRMIAAHLVKSKDETPANERLPIPMAAAAILQGI